MSLKTCYDALGGNYEQALERLRSERLVQKYVLRFLDEKSYETLTQAIAAKNGEEAFRAAHTIKGVCLNMSFDRLLASAEALTEALRHGWTDDAVALAERLGEDYALTANAIRAFKAELEA